MRFHSLPAQAWLRRPTNQSVGETSAAAALFDMLLGHWIQVTWGITSLATAFHTRVKGIGFKGRVYPTFPTRTRKIKLREPRTLFSFFPWLRILDSS